MCLCHALRFQHNPRLVVVTLRQMPNHEDSDIKINYLIIIKTVVGEKRWHDLEHSTVRNLRLLSRCFFQQLYYTLLLRKSLFYGSDAGEKTLSVVWCSQRHLDVVWHLHIVSFHQKQLNIYIFSCSGLLCDMSMLRFSFNIYNAQGITMHL